MNSSPLDADVGDESYEVYATDSSTQAQLEVSHHADTWRYPPTNIGLQTLELITASSEQRWASEWQEEVEPEEGCEPQPADLLARPVDSTYYSDLTAHSSSQQDYLDRLVDGTYYSTPAIRVSSQTVDLARPPTKKAAAYQSIKDAHTDNNRGDTDYSQPFPCLLANYGCTSTLDSKDDWKQHVHSQHLRLERWRCRYCSHMGGAHRESINFNRKDLFIQHVCRMHLPGPSMTKYSSTARIDPSDEDLLSNEAVRCYQYLRHGPQSSSCVFCDQHFHGLDSWEELMEHIGRHMENAKRGFELPVSPASWRRDEEMETWLLQERVIERHGDRLVLADADPAKYGAVHLEPEGEPQHLTSRVQSPESSALSQSHYVLHDHQTVQLDPVAEVMPQMIDPESNDENDTPEDRPCERPETSVDETPIDSTLQPVSRRLNRLDLTAESFTAEQSESVNTSNNVDEPELLDNGAKSAPLRATPRCFGCGQGLSTITAKLHIDESRNSACRQLYLILSQILQSKVTALQHDSSAHNINPSSPESSTGRSCTPSCTEIEGEETLLDLSSHVEGIIRLLTPSVVTRGADWLAPEQTDGRSEATSSSPASASLDSRPRESSRSSPRKRHAVECDVASGDETHPQIKTFKKKRTDGDGIPCICCERQGKAKETDQDFYPSLGAMHRHVRSRHRKFMCEDCFTLFDDDDQREQHRLYGKDPCSKPCSSQSCRRRVRGSCKWRWVSEPCKHLVTTKCQWWAASNVIYDPEEEQASKQGRIDFTELPVWEGILPDDIQEAFDSVITGEQDVKIAQLEQDLDTTRQNLEETTTRLQSRQDLLYTLWQSLRAAGRADAYLCGMVQRAAPELLAPDQQSVAGVATHQSKQGTDRSTSQGVDQNLASLMYSDVTTGDTALEDSGIWILP